MGRVVSGADHLVAAFGPNPRDYSLIRPDIREALVAYSRDGIPLGDFLQAVVANDLVEAATRADDGNQRALVALAVFVYNELDSRCWGSRAVYRAFLEWHAARRQDRRDLATEQQAAARLAAAHEAAREADRR